MRDFHLHELSEDEFENLVVNVCRDILGIGTVTFAKGPDGGRELRGAALAQHVERARARLARERAVEPGEQVRAERRQMEARREHLGPARVDRGGGGDFVVGLRRPIRMRHHTVMGVSTAPSTSVRRGTSSSGSASATRVNGDFGDFGVGGEETQSGCDNTLLPSESRQRRAHSSGSA